MGQQSEEKILLIRKLVEAMNLENGNYVINKLKVNDLIKEHSQAYHELLSIGFLQELNKSSDYQYNTNINFGNHNFLGHSIAKNLLHKNENRFDSTLIKTINGLFSHSPYKLTVLKWCIIDSIKAGQRDAIERLTEIWLTSNEKAGLIIFLGDLLDKETINGVTHGTMHSYFRQTFSEKMFDYFFGLELLSADYKKTLYTLLKFDLPNRKKILVYTALSVLAVTTMDLKELNALLAKLRSFSVSDYQYFAVNPLLCFEAIYQYFKFGTVNRACMIAITKLSFNPPEDPYNLKNSASNDMLYLLAAYTLLLSNNVKKILRFLNILETFYKKKPQEFDHSQYGFFIKMMLADIYFKLEDKVKIASVYYSISNSYKKEDNLLTPFMKTLFFALKIKLLLNSAKEDNIISEMKNVNDIVEQSGSKLSKFYVLSLLLQKNRFLMKHPGFKKQIFYDFVTLVRDADIHINEVYYVTQ